MAQGKFPAIDAPEGRPFARLLDGDEGGQQIVLGIEFGLAGEQAIEHIDDGFRAERARSSSPSLGRATKKLRQPASHKARRHGFDAQAIGIALDRRRRIRPACRSAPRASAPILLDWRVESIVRARRRQDRFCGGAAEYVRYRHSSPGAYTARKLRAHSSSVTGNCSGR